MSKKTIRPTNQYVTRPNKKYIYVHDDKYVYDMTCYCIMNQLQTL